MACRYTYESAGVSHPALSSSGGREKEKSIFFLPGIRSDFNFAGDDNPNGYGDKPTFIFQCLNIPGRNRVTSTGKSARRVRSTRVWILKEHVSRSGRCIVISVVTLNQISLVIRAGAVNERIKRAFDQTCRWFSNLFPCNGITLSTLSI